MKIEKINTFLYSDRGEKGRAVRIGEIVLYFSYNELVGISDNKNTYAIVNYWGTTTGEHINLIEKDKRKRLKQTEFTIKANEILSRLLLLSPEQMKTFRIAEMLTEEEEQVGKWVI
ncbi:MAG: hypothetical protein ACYCS1_05420 [Gammaproteobacteria bacterium]